MDNVNFVAIIRASEKTICISLGLFLNMVGTYILYKSIKAYPEYRGKDGEKKYYPIAVLDMPHAKKGLKCAIVGLILQLASAFIKG